MTVHEKKKNIIFNATQVFTFEFYIRMFDVFIWMAYGKAEIIKFLILLFSIFAKLEPTRTVWLKKT
jgi:hypothetical protein